MASAIELEKAGYCVDGRQWLVSDLSMEIQEGEMLVLLGRSGSGKTTTLKLINGLLPPSSGTIRVAGRSTREWDPIRLRRRIGYVIQEVGLFPHFSVARNVGLVPTLEGWPAERVADRTREMLDLVGLDPRIFLGRRPRELSGGQRQRVGIARALAADPPILLLDEPFGALDPITTSEILQELQSIHRRLGKTMVFVTHDIRSAFKLATRIGLMRAGTLAELVSPDQFLALSDPEAQAFARSLR